MVYFELNSYLGGSVFVSERVVLEASIFHAQGGLPQADYIHAVMSSRTYRGVERRSHSITYLESGDSFAHLDDGACDVFTKNGRILLDDHSQRLDRPVKWS